MENKNIKKAKVLLIQPPQLLYAKNIKRCVPPLGLAYIAGVLEEDNFDVKILDAYVEGYENEKSPVDNFILVGLDWDEIKKRIKDFNPSFVGISGMFDTQDKSVLKTCKIIKEVNPDTKIFIGGSYPTYNTEEVLKIKDLDFVILHEAEYTVKELLNKLVNNEDISDIAGLGYKQNGEIKVNKEVKWIENLDELPMPARHLLPMEKYIKINNPHSSYTRKDRVTQMVSSRGCTAKCIFCTTVKFWGEIFRIRNPKLVVDEIEHLVKEYNIEEIHWCDDNFSLDKKNCNEILDEMIRRNIDIKWATPNGIAIWALDEELIEKMAKTGCYQLSFAVESANQDFLSKNIKKPLNLSRVKPLLKKAKECGITVHAFFIIGFPGETKEMIMNTLKYAEETGFDSVSINLATPLLGSDLYKICKEQGLLVDNYEIGKNLFKIPQIKTKAIAHEELTRLIRVYKKRINESLKERDPELYKMKYRKSSYEKGNFKVLAEAEK